MEHPPSQVPKELQAKQIKFEAARQKVERIVDKLGTPIDEGIKETVAILQAMDFATSSSCAGHRNENDEGLGLPYVELYTPAPQGWKEDIQKEQQWKQANLKQRERLLPLLNEFNAMRKTIADARLYFSDIGMLGGFRIESLSYIKPTSLSEAIEKVTAFQKEMEDFTVFLKEKYFSSHDN